MRLKGGKKVKGLGCKWKLVRRQSSCHWTLDKGWAVEPELHQQLSRPARKAWCTSIPTSSGSTFALFSTLDFHHNISIDKRDLLKIAAKPVDLQDYY